MVFLLTAMLLCLPFSFHLFTCDPVHSVTWLCGKWEYSAQHGSEKWKTARPSHTTRLQPAVWLPREKDKRECVSTCTRGSDKAEQTIGEGSQTHSTPLLCSSEEHVGRISKRTLDFFLKGEIKKNNKNTLCPRWTAVCLPDFLLYFTKCRSMWVVSVWRSTRSSALCRPYRWLPVMHCCPAPITAGTWNTGQLNRLGIKITSSIAGKRLCCTDVCFFQNQAWVSEWLVYTSECSLNKNFASHIRLSHLCSNCCQNGAAY